VKIGNRIDQDARFDEKTKGSGEEAADGKCRAGDVEGVGWRD